MVKTNENYVNDRGGIIKRIVNSLRLGFYDSILHLNAKLCNVDDR